MTNSVEGIYTPSPVSRVYRSEMNRIELEWQHLNQDELCGQIFDDKFNFTYTVIGGVKARGERKLHYAMRKI